MLPTILADDEYITRKEITLLLTQDSYYRKLQHWPLLKSSEISFTINKRDTEDIYHLNSCNFDPFVIQADNISSCIENFFPFINRLLLKFRDHLVACGGAVIKSIYNLPPEEGDIDLFFYDLTTEEANKMRFEAIELLINSFKYGYPESTFYIKRNLYTTTLYIEIPNKDTYEYQFIHRIYPDISSIIGGFDLSVCMVAYDGEEIYTTPLGAWSIKNCAIIIDTKRRSTSFEYRLRKYYKLGFTLIFPGMSNKSMQNFCRDYLKVYNIKSSENLCSNIQKEQNIFPYFKLTLSRLNLPSYDRVNIEDKLINKISDYSSISSHPKYFSDINAQQLRSDNLHSVSSILNLDINKDIREQLINDANNPNLMIDDLTITKFKDRVDEIRNPFLYKNEGYNELENKNIDFYRLLKCFGKLSPKAIEDRNTDKYYEYRDMIINKMKINLEICKENLIGIKWLTQNPGRQWTSSINPIIEDPREWYGKHYIPVITGIPSEIETLMRLMRLPKTESVWTTINNDVFNVICVHLLHNYANDAWNYIS